MEILRFHDIRAADAVPDDSLEYSVVAARNRGRWVCVRLKGRSDWCFPGGRRESGESMEENARRELFEETGALDYEIWPLGVYGVDHRRRGSDGIEVRERISWGGLYAAEIRRFGDIPEEFEIAERRLFTSFPLDAARFPYIMPGMMEWLNEHLLLGGDDFSDEG